jgi:hypothetical protein
MPNATVTESRMAPIQGKRRRNDGLIFMVGFL